MSYSNDTAMKNLEFIKERIDEIIEERDLLSGEVLMLRKRIKELEEFIDQYIDEKPPKENYGN